MKKILIGVIITVFFLAVLWRIDRMYFHPYIPDFADQIRNDVTTLKFTVPKDKIACESAGGIWKKMGPRPVEECNLPTKDSGKTCSGSHECEGVCLAQLSAAQMREGMKGVKIKTNGNCSNVIKVMGCRGYVYQGWAQVVCAD
jgi:hypothetical protein